MANIIKRLRAKTECRKNGHDWTPAGEAYDSDGGMGGGRYFYRTECRRCGASCTSPTPYEKK